MEAWGLRIRAGWNLVFQPFLLADANSDKNKTDDADTWDSNSGPLVCLVWYVEVH